MRSTIRIKIMGSGGAYFLCFPWEHGTAFTRKTYPTTESAEAARKREQKVLDMARESRMVWIYIDEE